MPLINNNLVRLKPWLAALAASCLALGLYYQSHPLTSQPLPQAKPNLPGKLPGQVALKPPSPAKVAPAANQAKPAIQDKPFDAWLNNPTLSLNAGIADALKLWNKEPLATQPVDCAAVQKAGLSCLFDKGYWKDILAYNRPVILEFTLSPDVKRYALLKAVKDGQPIITFDQQDLGFPLADVLSYWDGYYLLLWQSPIPSIKAIYPGQSSDKVEWLRQQLSALDGTNPETKYPQYFDADLKARVIKFQQAHQLTPDGKVGMQTIFHLDNATGAKGSPQLKQD